jgi:uncharacterized protein (DUF427 family)
MSDQTNTKTKTIKIPGADHPITIERNLKRVVVSIGGRVLADSRDALILREAGYPAVQYIPRKDVDMTLLGRSAHATYCPYKGDCAYFNVPSGGERAINAAWTYEAPYDAVAAIKSYLAFYPQRVDAIEERPQ